jgi:hypothetical protein
MQLPRLEPWMIRLLAGLFGLYVLELVARNAGLDLYGLAWRPLAHGFAPWQLVTHYALQGSQDGAVTSVLFGLLMLYFALPAVDATVERGVWLRTLGAGAAAGVVLGLLTDAVGLAGVAPTMGWLPLTVGLFVMFGLALPQGIVKLFFVLDIPARWLVWMSLAFLALRMVVAPSLGAAEGLGVWIGVYGYWNLRGPGARRRNLQQRKQSIERELRRFEVVEGGRSSNRPDDDDLVH